MTTLASLTRAALRTASRFHASSLERVAAAAEKATDRARAEVEDQQRLVQIAKDQLRAAEADAQVAEAREDATLDAVTAELELLPFLDSKE